MSTPLPRGIEILLKKASVDAEFRELLLADSNQAAMSIELELAPVEQAMLQTLPKEQLATVIDRTEVPLAHRRAFLGTAAATMLALLTGSQDVCAQGVYGGMGGFTGTSPDVPKAPMGFVPNGGGWGPALVIPHMSVFSILPNKLLNLPKTIERVSVSLFSVGLH